MPNTEVRKQHVQPLLLLDQEQKEASEDSEQPPKCSFRLVNKIGQGGYGSVYLVQKNQGSDREALYAMKVCIYDCSLSNKHMGFFAAGSYVELFSFIVGRVGRC